MEEVRMRYVKKDIFGRIREYIIGSPIDVVINFPPEEDVTPLPEMLCTAKNCESWVVNVGCGKKKIIINEAGHCVDFHVERTNP